MNKIDLSNKAVPMEFCFKIPDKETLRRLENGDIVCGFTQMSGKLKSDFVTFKSTNLNNINNLQRTEIINILGQTINSNYLQIVKEKYTLPETVPQL